MDDLDDLIVEILHENGLTMPLEWIVDKLEQRSALPIDEVDVWDRLNGSLQERGVYQATAPSGIVYGITSDAG